MSKLDNYKKTLLPFMILAGMLENEYGSIGLPRRLTTKKELCICKKCGKEFTPISENKKIYCSVECFKNR